MTLPARHIGISINCPADKAYEFASDPMNLPTWATGLSEGKIRKDGEKVIADSPMGKITIQFAKKNTFGVLDHDVTLESGQKFYNPMRVFPNGDGCEVTFALYRQPDMSDADFEKDAATIEGDLRKLKGLLEKK
jgi:hypothetical protein